MSDDLSAGSQLAGESKGPAKMIDVHCPIAGCGYQTKLPTPPYSRTKLPPCTNPAHPTTSLVPD